MSPLVSPAVLYLALVVGALGVAWALPRKGPNPQALGALAAAGGAGLVVLLLTARAVRGGEGPPNLFFYIFALVGLGGALRVVTHRRPVYAALYFILTILASAGMYVVLAAEFMAFALVIVYAGAILITYLFVIMLATEAPTEEHEEALAEYDAVAREPLAATGVGFLLLAVLTTMLFAGAPALRPAGTTDPAELAARLPGSTEAALRAAGAIGLGDRVVSIDAAARTAEVVFAEGQRAATPLPEGVALAPTNVEALGINLLADYPGSIEIAGVVLLMAMLGAVVLARRKVQLEEEDRARATRPLGAAGGEGP